MLAKGVVRDHSWTEAIILFFRVSHASCLFPSFPHCLLTLSTLTAGPRPYHICPHPVLFDLYMLERADFIKNGAAIYRHFPKTKSIENFSKKLIFFLSVFWIYFFPFKMDLQQPGKSLCSSVEERQADQTDCLTLLCQHACIIDEHITSSFLWPAWMCSHQKWEVC